MIEQVKYIIGNILSIPLFPILYFQGKHIRKSIPQLPEAKVPQGVCDKGNQPFRLLGLGESTIAGVGVVKHEQGFTGHLAKLLAAQEQLQINWQVIARSGYTAKRVTSLLIPKLEGITFDFIVVGLGGNDTFKMTSPKQWKNDLEVLIETLQVQQPNAKIVFVNVPPIRSFPAFTPIIKFVLGRQVDLLHEVLKKVVHQYEQVWYVEERIKLQYWLMHFKDKAYTPKDFFSDGVHPSELTYQTWAGEVADFIKKHQII